MKKIIKLSDHFSYIRLIRFVIPTILMIIVTSVYSIIDGLFISNFVGKEALAAINLIFPILFIAGSMGFMIGTGGSALVAKVLGQGENQRASCYFSMLIAFIIVIGIIISIFVFIFIRKLAFLAGANDLLIDDCVRYGRIQLVSNTMFMLQIAFQNFLVVAERPKLGLVISVLSGVTNMILDLMLIYFFEMGVTGAALATAISQFVGGSLPLIYFSRSTSSLLRLIKPILDLKALKQSCLNGSSEMLAILASSFVSILYNHQLMKVASEDGVAAYSAIMYMSTIFMSLFFGFSVGSSPIISYKYGAKNIDQLRNIFKKALIINGISGILMFAFAELMASPLAWVFVGYDQELLKMMITGMHLFSFTYLISGFNIFGSSLFTALNNGPLSAVISFMRTIVFQVVAVMILPKFLGINGIWLSAVMAESLTLIITVLLLVTQNKHYHYFSTSTLPKKN